MKLKLDNWQKEILDYKGDILLLKGRRIGATYIMAIKAVERMIKEKTKIVMVSLTEDQAQLIVMIALEYLEENYKQHVNYEPKRKPTLNYIPLKNGSELKVRPVGTTGEGVRGFDGDILGIDEAPRQPKKVWTAARPVITTSGKAELWMWGTPAGKEGYFWEQYKKAEIDKDKDARFKVWHLSSEEVLFNRPICKSWTKEQAENVKKTLEYEKKDMGEIEYSNEYLGMFMDDISTFFSEEWIENVCTGEIKAPHGKNYMGIDCARFGRDESTWVNVEEIEGKINQLNYVVKNGLDTVQGASATENEAELWKPKKIGIDAEAGTIGVSWMDLLKRTKWKNKLIPLNNRKIVIEIKYNKEIFQKMLKEDMYYLVLSLGEQGRLTLLNDINVKASLASISQEIVKSPMAMSKIRIIGKKGAGGDHIIEAIVRAVYLAEKEKTLNLWAY